MDSVAITGIGTVSAFGTGSQTLAAGLASGAPRLTELDRPSSYHVPGGSRLAALAGEPKRPASTPALSARRMSRPSRFAVAAAGDALAQAGQETPEEAGTTSVALASTFGPIGFTERLLRQMMTEGPEAASPFLFSECVANAPAAQVALVHHARGPNHTIAQREAGALLAVMRGAADIRTGRATRALVGAVDEFTPLLHSILDRFGALARSSNGTPEEARPFDRRRNGVLFGEGATVLVLEEESVARARGARILARILGGGRAFDATASRVGWGRNHRGLARALTDCLQRAGRSPDRVDLVISGAGGARAGDRLEALVLRGVWNGEPMPPVLAPKSVTGEYGGGFLGAAVLAASGAAAPKTAGFREPDPELNLIPHDGRPLPLPEVTVVSSLAAGGAAAWLVLGRP